jgi:hypothetical protein
VAEGAQVQTKTAQSLADSRDITVIILTNPTSSPISSYTTSVDPALILAKPAPVDQVVLDLAGMPIPAWYSKYGTGLSSAEILYKSSIMVNGVQQISIGDGPYVNDIGPVVDIPDVVVPSLDDNWHKVVVTDLSDCDVVIQSDAQSSYIFSVTGVYTAMGSLLAQDILFPVSSRHIVKTPDGTLHAVCSYIVSSISRIFYLKSTNGGETWVSTIVDNDDGQSYIMPSITCDSDNGIHITYTRYDAVNFDTIWAFCGSDIPAGFEMCSDAGNIGYHRVLIGEQGTYYPASLVGEPDPLCHHNHGMHTTNGTPSSCYNYTNYTGASPIAACDFHHASATFECIGASSLPVSKSIKLLRYHGLPPSLPADIIVPFKSPVPVGYSRYSEQDLYPLYGSTDVGVIVGSAQHRHAIDYSLTGDAGHYSLSVGSATPSHCDHLHIGTAYTPYSSNLYPLHSVILGRVVTPRTILSVDAILMLTGAPTSFPSLTSLSAIGEELYRKIIIGDSTYYDGGVATFDHHHEDAVYTTVAGGVATTGSTLSGPPGVISCAVSNHGHNFVSAITDNIHVFPTIGPRMYGVNSEIDLSPYGNDLFYRYISPSGVLSSVVNVSLIQKRFPSFEGTCLVDGSGDIHFIWAAQGLNSGSNINRARICYKKISSGVPGSRTDLTTSDNHMLYPSLDIDKLGDIHTAWFNATTCQSLEYRKCSSGVWGDVEILDSDSYVGYPSNIITDKDCNVFLLYAKWTDVDTAIKEVFYRKRTSGVWGDATNLSPNKAVSGYNQFTGQIYLDNKGNVMFTWSGKGYGAHAGVYHPVYRYVTAAGSVIPTLAGDAVDMFPDDDNEIIYPNVFWHYYPVVDSVYHNLVVAGITIMYLYNPRGTLFDVADIKFFSSSDALVGDIGPLGLGGLGDSDLFAGGVSGESVLQKNTYTVGTRGYVCRSSLVQSTAGSYLS